MATAMEEDALLYGGSAYYVVDEGEDKLKEMISKAPATNWPDYGKSSYEALKAVNFDWSKLDPSFFTIGRIDVTCKGTGRNFGGGKINEEMLKKALTF
jgi:methenyltetrahydromethanopterin cyclohydrolase